MLEACRFHQTHDGQPIQVGGSYFCPFRYGKATTNCTNAFSSTSGPDIEVAFAGHTHISSLILRSKKQTAALLQASASVFLIVLIIRPFSRLLPFWRCASDCTRAPFWLESSDGKCPGNICSPGKNLLFLFHSSFTPPDTASLVTTWRWPTNLNRLASLSAPTSARRHTREWLVSIHHPPFANRQMAWGTFQVRVVNNNKGNRKEH